MEAPRARAERHSPAPTPSIARTTCDDAPIWVSNCNGGMYLLPGALAAMIGEKWKHHARSLYASRDLLEGYAHHIDQISFAMAILDLGLEVEALAVAGNFPLHLAAQFAAGADINPRVLHVHWLRMGDQRLMATGHPGVDRAVEAVNAVLA
ncbi:hypothetical protein [Xanthobacter sp. VNH20]|uniref:hypothetical protein n=1 Tax=Xanthobacter sp. VNH20 TaxID=3156616 RepID=UPI0032B384B6